MIEKVIVICIVLALLWVIVRLSRSFIDRQ